MNETSLHFEDAISRIRFAPQSNNLLISSWDSSLRLYDVDSFKLRLEAQTEAAVLDCYFQSELVALSAGSDGSIRRYDLHSGIDVNIGNHDDLATCVEYSDETCQVITAGWDKKIRCWDSRSMQALGCLNTISMEVQSMSLCGFSLMAAIGASVYVYDLRKFNQSFHSKELCVDIRIKCVRSTLDSEGFAAGSFDERVSLKYFHPSDPNNNGYAFRCHPKKKDGRRHLAAVNDIAFNPSISGAFITGDNDGYVSTWNAQSKKRLFELPRFPNSIASLSYNNGGQLLAVASSYTYQEANETEKPPQIFIHDMDEFNDSSFSSRSSQ